MVSRNSVRAFAFFLLDILIITGIVQAGITGKIAGTITDSSDLPLVGVLVTIDGASRGTISDLDGAYLLLSLAPGRYTLSFRLVGYEGKIVQDVLVSSDYTTSLTVQLKQTVLAGESVTVTAEKPLLQRDLTFTTASLSESRIAELPAEAMERLLQLQTGVTVDTKGKIHMRGGRATEVGYLVDGIPVTDGFDRSQAIDVDNSSIQELQVISGAFNAEYGQAQSGIVNIITKKGSNRFCGSVTAYAGDYHSSDDDLFYHIQDFSPLAARNLITTFSGPAGIFDGSFFLATRHALSDGWLYGRREYSLPTNDPNSEGYTTYNSHSQPGDSAFIPMNDSQRHLVQGRFDFSLGRCLPFRYSLFYNWQENGEYDPRFARFPDADSRTKNNALSQNINLDYLFSARSFLSVNYSQLERKTRRQLFADPFDERSLFPAVSIEQIYQCNQQEGLEYLTDFTNNERYHISNLTRILKLDLTSQLHPLHLLKAGLEIKNYRIGYSYQEVINKPDNKIEKLFIPYLDDQDTPRNDHYTNRPFEAALYMQDKIEYKEIVVNVGLRFDYFDSRGSLPSVLDQKDGLVLSAPRKHASIKTKLSPRLGLAFPISDQGVIHFSYGHFSQIPDFKSLYWNSEYEIRLGALSTMVGNPDLAPETTISWESGVQHQLAADMALDATIYFKDIKNLLGQEIIRLKGGQAYARYINRDYGNVRGFIVSLEKRLVRGFSANVDYTFQVARGNASDHFAVFTDNQGTPPRESEKQVLPLDWDQRHTLNASATFSRPDIWGISIIFQAGSGLPYTPTDPNRSLRTAFENSARKPVFFNCDLSAHYGFSCGMFAPSLFFRVYNLFDTRNEIDVFTDTGRAAFTHTLNYQLGNRRPDFYSAPRLVMAGIAFTLGEEKKGAEK